MSFGSATGGVTNMLNQNLDTSQLSSQGDIVTVIQPQSGWQFINFKELLEYKDLFLFLAWRDIKVLYAQTILGFLWAILQPLSQIIIFTIIFGKVAKNRHRRDPLFSFHDRRNHPLDVYLPGHGTVQSEPGDWPEYTRQGLFSPADLSVDLSSFENGRLRDFTYHSICCSPLLQGHAHMEFAVFTLVCPNDGQRCCGCRTAAVRHGHPVS
jgi:hypothetical protein